METRRFDIVVIGAGIAGATAAAHLAPDHRTALVEAEDVAGYHSTGRSAAIWLQDYGTADGVWLARDSRDFLTTPPSGFTEAPLLLPRGVLYLAPAGAEGEMRALLAESTGLRELKLADAYAMIPAIRPGYAAAAAIDTEACDIDVATLHQGYLRQFRAHGGVLALGSRTTRIERNAGGWKVVAGDRTFFAPILVNTAGAWGDEVARQAGVGPLGLQPKRRTGVIIDPAPWQPAAWPMLQSLGTDWYTRPEARTRLMLSPADETDMHPHDVQPDELDIAIAVDRMQQALDIDVKRVERAWAGLRTFTPDRGFAIGFDALAEGFFWCVGQGGSGILTSPSAGRLVANLIGGRDPGAPPEIMQRLNPRRFILQAA